MISIFKKADSFNKEKLAGYLEKIEGQVSPDELFCLYQFARELKEKEKNAQRTAVAKQQFEEDRQSWQEKLEMTGGTNESVAQPFRDRGTDSNAGHAPGI